MVGGRKLRRKLFRLHLRCRLPSPASWLLAGIWCRQPSWMPYPHWNLISLGHNSCISYMHVWGYNTCNLHDETDASVYLSSDRRLKHTVLPYNYLYIYACLCARPAWCRDRLNTGRQQPFTARLGPKTRLGAKVFVQVLLQSKYRYGGSYQYCTVEIPTEMEFTGTFQKYLQCANRTWFSDIRNSMLKPPNEL